MAVVATKNGIDGIENGSNGSKNGSNGSKKGSNGRGGNETGSESNKSGSNGSNLGHSAYFRFHPNLAREGFDMLAEDHESFIDQLEALEDNTMNFDFDDEYLQKSIEHGFFSKDGFEELRSNVMEIMRPIAGYLPALFPEKKKKK